MNEITRINSDKKAAPRRAEMRVRPTAPILPPTNIQGTALIVVIAIIKLV